MHPGELLPNQLLQSTSDSVKGTRVYLESLVHQINGSYDCGFYDACATMCRRLMESLIIEIYIHNGRHHEIQSEGVFLRLERLIAYVRADKKLALGRNTPKTMTDVKQIGDTAAHDRVYITSRQDIDDLLPKYRRMFQDLLAACRITNNHHGTFQHVLTFTIREAEVATAKLVLPDGTTVNIEGTADEVATLLARFSADSSSNHDASKRTSMRPHSRSSKGSNKNRPKRKGPRTLLEDLAKENFFKSKRTIGEVKKKLEEKGHIYALNSLSTPLLRLTRNRVLRRIKEKSGWVYVS